MRVLLIDDDESVRRFARLVLEGAGHEVAEASGGRDGAELYRRLGADVLVTDLFMPGRDGLEVILDLVPASPGLRIVAVNGGGYGGRVDLLDVSRSLGAVEVLPKPYRPAELLAAVGRAAGTTAPA
jgi:CheY-like chemotaxis protein